MNGSHSRPVASRCTPSILTTARTGPDCSTVTFWTRLSNVTRGGDVRRTGRGPLLQDAHEPAGARDLAAADAERGDEIGPTRVEGAGERARVDGGHVSVLRDAHVAGGGGGGSGSEDQVADGSDRHDRGAAGPFERAVRPVGQGPGLQRHGVAGGVGQERRRHRAARRPAGQGTPQLTLWATAAPVVEPVKAHRRGGGVGGRIAAAARPRGQEDGRRQTAPGRISGQRSWRNGEYQSRIGLRFNRQ